MQRHNANRSAWLVHSARSGSMVLFLKSTKPLQHLLCITSNQRRDKIYLFYHSSYYIWFHWLTTYKILHAQKVGKVKVCTWMIQPDFWTTLKGQSHFCKTIQNVLAACLPALHVDQSCTLQVDEPKTSMRSPRFNSALSTKLLFPKPCPTHRCSLLQWDMCANEMSQVSMPTNWTCLSTLKEDVHTKAGTSVDILEHWGAIAIATRTSTSTPNVWGYSYQ